MGDQNTSKSLAHPSPCSLITRNSDCDNADWDNGGASGKGKGQEESGKNNSEEGEGVGRSGEDWEGGRLMNKGGEEPVGYKGHQFIGVNMPLLRKRILSVTYAVKR